MIDYQSAALLPCQPTDHNLHYYTPDLKFWIKLYPNGHAEIFERFTSTLSGEPTYYIVGIYKDAHQVEVVLNVKLDPGRTVSHEPNNAFKAPWEMRRMLDVMRDNMHDLPPPCLHAMIEGYRFLRTHDATDYNGPKHITVEDN